MSTTRKVAIASAAGVLAATAAGLAATRTGRRLTKQAANRLSELAADRVSTVMDSLEAGLAQTGLLSQRTSAKGRSAVHTAVTRRTSSRRRTTRAKPGVKRRTRAGTAR